VKVAFDAGMLSLLLHQTARFPVCDDGKPVTRPKDRIEHLIAELGKADAQIIIPAPAFAEFLNVVEDAGPAYLAEIEKTSTFTVEPFDTQAAVEAAWMFRTFKAKGDKRGGAEGPYQRVKVDQQIVAIARAKQAERVYTTDGQVVAICATLGMDVLHICDLPLPPEPEPPPLFRGID
jgi:hypothetical protein